MSQPNPPPLPSIAFCPRSGVVLNGELLSKGFITPKKEKEAHFFRRRSHSSSSEQLVFNSSSPSAVGILVGSRENIEQWLRESGPGTSCLWVEAEDFSQNAGGKILARQLKLIYRLHSEKSFISLPVLDGIVVEKSPPIGSHRDEGGLRKAHCVKKTIRGEVKRSSFTVQPERQSPSNISSNSTRDVSPSIDTSARLGENEKSMGLVIPEKAYRRLELMLSGDGIIREFQELLRRVVVSSNFLDVDNKLLDLQQWLKNHPFAAFLEGNDVLVIRRGDGLSGLRWVVLRFDFFEGHLKSITGEDLKDLDLMLRNNAISKVSGIQVSWWGKNSVSCGNNAHKIQQVNPTKSLVWKIRTMSVKNGDCSGGLLTRLLLDAFGGVERFSAAERNSFESLFDSPTQVDCRTPARSRVLETVLAFGRSKGMSWKEQCALSHLKSSSKELKGRGLHVLLNLLLGMRPSYFPVTDPMMHGTLDVLCPGSSYSNSDSSYYRAVGEFDTCLLGEGVREVALKENDSQTKQGWEPLRIMDWLNCGFLEVLLERTIVKSGDNKVEGMEIDGVLNIEVALETCLRILELLPKEGSSELAKVLVASLQETYEDFLRLHLNPKQNGNFDLSMQMRSHASRREGKPFTCVLNTMKSNTQHANPNLKDMFEKVLRFCKLLSLLESRSPLVGGPFAKSGGLDLILDMYFCLVKRFPINLRFGVLSNVLNICKNLEQNLPGETLKSLQTPVKVLPCILPRACISGVAHACLMDHTMSPKTKIVDFAWPPNYGWKVLYPFNDPLDSLDIVTKRSSYEFPFDNPLRAESGWTHDYDLLPKVPERVESHKPYLSTQNVPNPERDKGRYNSSGVTSLTGNGCSSPSAMNLNNSNDSCVESPAILQRTNLTRPLVPRLPLSSLRRSTMRFGPSKVDFQEAMALRTHSADSSLCQVSSNTRASTARFEILHDTFNAKCELLQTLIQLFANCSHSLLVSKSKLLQKFQKEDEDYLALQFLPDIISSFLQVVPESLSKRTKKMLFEVISLLDRGKVFDDTKKSSSSPNGRTYEVPVMPCKVGQGILLSGSKRLVDSLLLDIGERLRMLLHHLENVLCASSNSNKETTSNKKKLCVTTGNFEHCDPLLENHTMFNGRLLNLWVDIGLLLGALADFVALWPEEGLVQSLLDSCGTELESVMRLLAEFSDKSSWSLAQILTMEHFLKLLTICIKNSVLEKSSEFQIWSTIDAFLWQLLIVNDLNWNCVKNFTTLVVMKSCQGCITKLLEGYQRVLWEPLEIFYSMFGEQINNKSASESPKCSLHGVEMMKSIFSFLKVSILMMKKRLNCHNQTTQSCPTLLMERLVFLLDFLMNPVEGILMNIIKSPIPCVKVNNTHSEIEALNLLSSTKLLGSTQECHVYKNPKHIWPAIHDSLFLNYLQESCRKCPIKPCAASCSHKFTSYLKKKSLGILAEIFSLKYFDDHDELSNLCINPRRQNPFLFWKYVNPFLEIAFFYFLKHYNKQIESNESSKISPLTQSNSWHFPIIANNGQESSGHTRTREASSTHDTLLHRNDKDFCLDCVLDDKVSSTACVTYGKVLRALAQNQSEDVNQSFQQTRVMTFLVQQIGLEYEISQVATPREVVIPITKLSPQELQVLETGTSKARLLFTGKKGKSSLPHSNEDIDPCKVIVEENNGHGKMETIVSRTIGNLVVDEEAIELELLLSKKSSTNLRDLHELRTSSEQHVQNELVVDTSLSLGQQSDNNVLKKCSLKSLEVCSTQTLFESESGILDKSNMTSEESNVVIESHTRHMGTTVANRFGKVNSGSTIDQTDDAHVLHKDLHGGNRGSTTSSILKEVKYTGRFFDLNEEVERELAQEEFSCNEIYLQEVDKIGHATHFDVLEDIQEESNLQEFGLKLALFDATKSRIDKSNKSSSSTLFSEKRLEVRPKQKPRHPPIPRLNLSKSVRKGGPTIKLDTLTNFEFLPSTISTLDFKFRPSAILELQQELHKEVLSSDRSSKSWEIGASYKTGCLQRRLYRHIDLHVLLLELFVSLMLTPQGTLETSYSDRYPMENRKLNAPFFLSYHLNHAANVYLLPCLSKRMKEFKPAAFRILKLTWRALFNSKIYTNKVHIARGAASQVYTAKVKRNCGYPEKPAEELVVLKVVDVPKGPYDPCKFFDVYSEVEILEKFLGEPAICQILDYGVNTESFILVLKHYKCSLHTWRQGQIRNSGNGRFSPTEIDRVRELPKFVLERLPLYLEVYSAILQAVKKLEIENVVHYDLKCDNILLEPLDSSCLESEFWTPRWPPANQSKPLPFCICIADFGQSKASTHLGGECTVRNRGTEYVKSPEMLKLLSSQSQRDTDFNMRTTDEGVGKAVDVWSLGCLLYELLTGEYLFYDKDWLQFFMRVTLPSEELISKEKVAKLENYGPVVDLLKFILVRDPLQRPSLDEVTICVEQLQLKLEAQPLTTTCGGNEVPRRFQTLSESDSDIDESNIDGQILSPKTNIAQDEFRLNTDYIDYNNPDGFKQKTQAKNSLEHLRKLCCCQCGEGS